MLVVDEFSDDAFSRSGRIGKTSPVRVDKSPQYFAASGQVGSNPATRDSDTFRGAETPAIARRFQAQLDSIVKGVDSCFHFITSCLQFGP